MAATDAAGFVTSDSKRKKSFYAEEEDIVVKPSTELIPDEYEHLTNEGVLLHIFRTATHPEDNLAEDLMECVKKINYKVDDNNIHNLNNTSEFKEDLEHIKKEVVNKSALLLIFIGYFGQDEGTLLMLEEKNSIHMKEVWETFSANKCQELKYKPKIFIFCTSQQPVARVQIDSMRHRTMNYEKIYDFPAESDMLIVYKKVDEPLSRNKEQFLYQLCENIETYSKKYDLIDLVSYINSDSKSVPLIISTLTRKFYLTPNEDREHYLSVVENHSDLEESLIRIQANIQKLHDAQKKKKEKKFSFSFKKKSEEKPKIVKKKEDPIVEQPKPSKTVAAPNSTVRLSAGSSVGRRSRVQSETEWSLVGGRRSKQPETDSSVQKKPIWKI